MKIGWRIWLLIAVLLLSLLAIHPTFQSGVVIKSVEHNSSAFDAGIQVGEIIKSINGIPIADAAAYTAIASNFSSNGENRIDIITNADEYVFLSTGAPAITVDNVQRTNIQTGLDLRGGARALVKPSVAITDSQLGDLIEVSRNRFNVYGLSDVQIRGVTDLDGNKFMLIEIAGATPSDLEELIAKQGKFEAKIKNETVFVGGVDIADVCRNDAKCAGITQCAAIQDGEACSFRFSVFLTEEAAKRHANITKDIPLDETGKYLTEKLYLYVDGNEVESLAVSAGLKGQATTQISIEGSGTGKTREDAFNNAKAQMNKLQTILITGSLPYQLEIEKLDTISPTLGSDFIRTILIAGGVAILSIAIIIFVRYRKFKASLALLFTSLSEIAIILGAAAFIKWNLDLPSIAGILATIGTGVDQQIIILDETTREKITSFAERMKRALFIVVGAYATNVASLIPLYWAGAGLFKGFAFTTIIGITAGVLITRPAFAEMIKKMSQSETGA